MYNLQCGPCNNVKIVKTERKKCPPRPRPHPLTSDPDAFDPRPPFPCSRNPCCICRPVDPQPQPKRYDLKLKLLQDCYNCRVSDKCERRQKTFYDRWQLYLDRLKRYPNYDYKVYCCDDYVDLSENKDLCKFSYFKPNRLGKRERDRRNFIWPEVLFQSFEEQECMRDATKPIDACPCRTICDTRDTKYYNEANFHLTNCEPFTIWHEKVLGPRRFVEGSTPIKNRGHPFHKDVSFSTPLWDLSTGNESPFKEIRDLNLAM